jgi:hypothetical protein
MSLHDVGFAFVVRSRSQTRLVTQEELTKYLNIPKTGQLMKASNSAPLLEEVRSECHGECLVEGADHPRKRGPFPNRLTRLEDG